MAAAIIASAAFSNGAVLFDETGALKIDGDKYGMNWILRCDGTQYAPVIAEDSWGTVELGVRSGELGVTRDRREDGNDLVENVTISNRSDQAVDLAGAKIKFPFNDNYTTAEECVTRRCNAHLWPFGSAAWACLIRMGGEAPHLGWMLTKGEVDGYAVSKRDKVAGHDASNFRGVFAFLMPDKTLSPGETYTLEWRLFSHDGWEDFKAQLVKRGGLWVEADKYVAQVGEEIAVKNSASSAPLRLCVNQPGETNVMVEAGGKWTRVELLAVSDYRKFIERRLDFILDHQQYMKDGDVRDGAFLPYDNETDAQYFDWLAETHRYDMDEGRERIGIGIAIAEWMKRGYANPKALPALKKYAHFIRAALQREDYKTFSEVLREKHRIYNYAWVARFYFDMYELTGDAQYLDDGVGTILAMFKYGGHNFYVIDLPVRQSIETLRKAGREEDAERLLTEYRKAAANYLANGITPPKSEMYYEQSIISPAAQFLAEMFLVTKEEKYRKGCEVLLPVLEAFNGHQPSWHLNDVGIRHWDGYWFGKRRLLGDTMPHYWSCISADFFGLWAEIAGDKAYARRASEICKANFGLFAEDGRGGAAWMYTNIINGQPGRFLEPMANDETYALAFAARWL